jgi:hypothetical protein
MTAMSHVMIGIYTDDALAHHITALPSPYRAVPVEAGPDTHSHAPARTWLVMHRTTHVVACKHKHERYARACAAGKYCYKKVN